MLERFVYGWQAIECPLLASLAMRFPVMLLARHGTAKSLVMKVLTHALGLTGRLYVAPVEDLTTLAGLPDPRAMAEGRFCLVPHGRSLQGAQAIGIDELPRAPHNVQNLFLEVLLDRTILGQPLDLDIIVATMNPDTYASSNSLDEALADRFPMVLNAPDCQELDPDERAEMLAMGYAATAPPEDIAAKKLADLPTFLAAIQDAYQSLEKTSLEAVVTYASRLLTLVHTNFAAYISPRREVLFLRSVLACAAYYYVALGQVADEALKSGALKAVHYCLAVPLGLEPDALLAHHNALACLLQAQQSQRDQYLIEIAQMHGAKLLDYLSTTDKAIAVLTPVEKEKILAELVDDDGVASLALVRLVDKMAPDSVPLKQRALSQLTQTHDGEYSALRCVMHGLFLVDPDYDAVAQRLAELVEAHNPTQGSITPASIAAVSAALAALQEPTPDLESAIRVLASALPDDRLPARAD